MKKKKGKVKAIYIIAALWILWSIGFPLFKVLHFLILIGVSVAVLGAVLKALNRKETNPQTDNSDIGQNAAEQRTVNNGNVKIVSRGGTTTYTYTYTDGQNKGNANPYSSNYRASASNSTQTGNGGQSNASNNNGSTGTEQDADKNKGNSRKKTDRQEDLYAKYGITRRERTGDSTLDKMIEEEEKALLEMKRLDESIEDEKVSAQIVHLEEVTTRIVNCVVDKPEKKNQVKRFFSYYLPTSLKLLNAYDRMDETGINGTNIDGAKGGVEEMMDKALEAFDRQLDALYADEALDVSTEIKVMQGLLASEGLTDDEIMKALK